MRRAIAIVRVSQVAGREGDTFASPTIQRDRIQAECARASLELVQVLEELDVSGGADIHLRPGLGPAVAAIEAGEADVIIAAYFDRFFRSLTVQAQVIERVEAAGGQVLAVDFGHVTAGTAAQWLSSTVTGMMADYYRRVAKERSAEAQQRAINRGIPPWPHIVPGYQRGPDRRLILTADAPTMLEAFEMRDQGARVADIREFLRAHGIDRNSHQVSSLLGSRTYLGEIHFGHYTPNLDAHDPIVDRALFDRVQAVRVPQGRKAKKRRLLARLGVLRCGTCDARMVIGSQRRGTWRYEHYRCPAEDCPRRVTIGADIADTTVSQAVRAEISDLEGRASIEQDVRAAEIELERAEVDLRNGIRNLAVVSDEPDAHAKLLELRTARDGARERVDRLRGQRAARTVGIAAQWELLTLEEQRGFVVDLGTRAVVRVGGRGAERIKVEFLGE